MQSLLKATKGGVIEDAHISNYLGDITVTKYNKTDNFSVQKTHHKC